LEGGFLMQLTAKELMHLEDYLVMEQTCGKNLNFYSNQIQDQQLKSALQQMAQKSQGNFQRMVKHLNDQKLQ
jgi:ferritin-like metal-binding protein YciE